jgi:Spy/CpxP family protein refolding chaperone
MKRLALSTMILVLLSAATAWSGEEQKPKSGGVAPGIIVGAGAPNAWAGGAYRSAADWYIQSLDKIVNLTDAQKAAMRDIFAARDKTMSDFQTKNAEKLKAASAAMMEAYKSKNKEAQERAQKAYQELYAPMYEAMKKANEDLQKILTPEQKAKQQDNQLTTWIKSLTNPVQLSDEQLVKAKAACREAAKNGDFRATYRAVAEAVQAVTTPEQKTRIFKIGVTNYLKAIFSRAKLSDKQMKQLEAIVDEAAKTPDLKLQWPLPYEKLRAKVNDILTPEQKEAMKKPFRYLAPAVQSAPAGGWQVSPGQVKIEGFGELKPGEKKGEKRPMIVLAEARPVPQYWLGVCAEPVQGLLVGQIAPDSPAAKCGLKPHDLLLKAGDTQLKTAADLMEAVQKARRRDLPLDVLRDGQWQKITVKPAKRPESTVKPAKRPAEGLVYNLGDLLQSGRPGPSGVKITQLPGGTIRVVIAEEGEGKDGVQELRKEVRELRRQVEEYKEVRELRRQVEELRRMVKELSRPEKE